MLASELLIMIPLRVLPSLAILAASSASAISPCETRADSPDQPLWQPLLAWVPEDTETIIVAQGPFVVPERKPERFAFVEAAQLLPTGPLLGLQDGMLGKELTGQKILCAVEGSRHFTSPRSLGMMPYQGAHIVQFEAAASNVVHKAFELCKRKAEKMIELNGEPVAVFAEKHESDTWLYFVAQPKPGLLICATDQVYLEETLKRAGREPGKRALPSDLPEWKQVDLKAKVWAIRHYRKETAELDPSSPLRGEAPANVPDSAAVGLIFWYSPDSSDIARVRYLSDATNAHGIANTGWNHPSEGLAPEIKQAKPGSIEIVASVSRERTARSFLFVLLGYLGHGIYV